MRFARRLTPVMALVLSCAAPLFERAAIAPGLGGALGVSAGSRVWTTGTDDLYPDLFVQCQSGQAHAGLRYGVSESWALFIEAGGGPILAPDKRFMPPFVFDGQLGVKLRTGDGGAVKLGVGFPGVVDVTFLNDFAPRWTTAVGIGGRGLSLMAAHHIQLASWLQGHPALSVAVMPVANDTPGWKWSVGGCLGFGLEFGNAGSTEDDYLR